MLAIAGGSASAQTAEVVTFTTDTVPGTYTVEWETQGGCDPTMRDASTSGTTDPASGSYSRTVAVPGGTAGSATVAAHTAGEKAEFAVVTASHCNYVWTASFVSGLPGDEGARCGLTVGSAVVLDGDITPANNAPFTGNAFEFMVADTACTVSNKIKVTVGPSATDAGAGTYTSDGRYVEDGHISPEYDPDAGAVLSTTFTVTATPVKDPPQDAECEAVSKETKVVENDPDTRNDDKVEATLQVLETTLEKGATCKYDVVVELPAGFTDVVDGTPRKNRAKVTSFALNVPTKFDNDSETEDSGVRTTGADCGNKVVTDHGATDMTVVTNGPGDEVPVKDGPCLSLSVAVAERHVYITQSVVGDAGGGNARYTLTEDKACGIPDDLPKNLLGTGGISTVPSVTVVELREGHFNISTAVMAPTKKDAAGRFVAPRLALNYEADPCVVTAAVSHLPDNCSAAVADHTADLTTGVDARGRAVMRFDITCSDDMSDGDMSSDDMMGDGDMSSDDMMGGDDMGDGDMMSGGDMMGPPEDVATG